MAKQKLLRMAFTRSDVIILYQSLRARLEAIQKEANGRPSVAALEAVDVDQIMQRIVKAIAANGGLDSVAVTPVQTVDVVAVKHAKRTRKVAK